MPLEFIKVTNAHADGSLYVVRVNSNIFVSCSMMRDGRCYFDDIKNKIIFWEYEVDELYLIKESK